MPKRKVSKMKSENRGHKRLTNEALKCSDCRHRYDDSDPAKNFSELSPDGRVYAPTSICEEYDMKPTKVLLGGDCDKYESE